jgi:hypothetical protein
MVDFFGIGDPSWRAVGAVTASVCFLGNAREGDFPAQPGVFEPTSP